MLILLKYFSETHEKIVERCYNKYIRSAYLYYEELLLTEFLLCLE